MSERVMNVYAEIHHANQRPCYMKQTFKIIELKSLLEFKYPIPI